MKARINYRKPVRAVLNCVLLYICFGQISAALAEQSQPQHLGSQDPSVGVGTVPPSGQIKDAHATASTLLNPTESRSTGIRSRLMINAWDGCMGNLSVVCDSD